MLYISKRFLYYLYPFPRHLEAGREAPCCIAQCTYVLLLLPTIMESSLRAEHTVSLVKQTHFALSALCSLRPVLNSLRADSGWTPDGATAR